MAARRHRPLGVLHAIRIYRKPHPRRQHPHAGTHGCGLFPLQRRNQPPPPRRSPARRRFPRLKLVPDQRLSLPRRRLRFRPPLPSPPHQSPPIPSPPILRRDRGLKAISGV